jgi:hypothetical protein
MKIYELAKELGLSSREVIEAIAHLNIQQPANHLAVISAEDADCLRRHVIRRVISTTNLQEKKGEQPQQHPAPAESAPVVVRKRKDTAELIRVRRKDHHTPDRSDSTLQVPEQLLGTAVTGKKSS